MANARLGYDNRFDTASLTGGAGGIASQPIANLQDAQPSKTYGVTGSTMTIIADHGAAVPIDAVAIVRTNLTSGATLRFRVSSADATGAAGDVYDSGTIAAGADTRFLSGVLHAPPARKTGRYSRIDLVDAAARLDAAGAVAGIDAGRVFVGPLFTPGRNFKMGNGLGFLELGSKRQAPGGEIHIRRRRRPRAMSLTFEFVTEADYMTGVLELDRTIGALGDLLVIRNPASSYVAENWLWGVPAELSLPVNPVAFRWTKAYSVQERF